MLRSGIDAEADFRLTRFHATSTVLAKMGWTRLCFTTVALSQTVEEEKRQRAHGSYHQLAETKLPRQTCSKIWISPHTKSSPRCRSKEPSQLRRWLSYETLPYLHSQSPSSPLSPSLGDYQPSGTSPRIPELIARLTCPPEIPLLASFIVYYVSTYRSFSSESICSSRMVVSQAVVPDSGTTLCMKSIQL